MVFPTQSCMSHIFCLICLYCDNFFFITNQRTSLQKHLMHLWSMDFTSNNTNKLDMLCRIPEPLVYLWENAVFNYIFFFQTDRDLLQSCLLFNLCKFALPKIILATWKCLPTEMKCFCEKTSIVN